MKLEKFARKLKDLFPINTLMVSITPDEVNVKVLTPIKDYQLAGLPKDLNGIYDRIIKDVRNEQSIN